MHPLLDILAAACVAVGGSVAGTVYHPVGYRSFDAWAYLLTVCTAAPLAVRHRLPLSACAASCAAYTVYLAAGHQPSLNWWAPLLAFITVSELLPLERVLAATAPTTAVMLYSGLMGRLPLILTIAQPVLALPVAFAIGRAQRRATRRAAQLLRLNELMKREQEQSARRALAEERVRIARELHDVVAHHMSVIAVQAGLADYVFTTDPPAAQSALRSIGDVSREALDELRRIYSALRVEHDEERDAPFILHPLPGLNDLGALVERMRGTGMTVALQVEGEPTLLPPGVELCAYRMVQEALTNVLKHAGPVAADVVVRHGPERLSIAVGNAAGTPSKPPGESSGNGLIGMRERARICGGELTAAHRPDGGFAVRLTLPTVQAAPQDASGGLRP
jgi:signal transduction histidine kinase